MQFDASTVVAIVAAVVAGLFAIYSQIVSRHFQSAQRELALSLAVERSARELLEKRLVDEEKATIRQDGQIALVRQGHDGIERDMDEVKKMVKEVLMEVRRGGHGSGGGYSSVRNDPPPRPR